MYKKKSSQYWPGFYTYVLKKDDNGKSLGGYEFDIFEPLDNREINQTTHWPFPMIFVPRISTEPLWNSKNG